jgi:hypothetical protein
MIETPEDYKRFLKGVGGVNPYGDPAFILLWGENQTINQLKIPQPFIAPYFNCWILAEWHSAEDWGSPSDWLDELGPYPSRGGYTPLAVFRNQKREPVKLGTRDLNFEVLQMWVYLALKHEHDRISERLAFYEDVKRKEEESRISRIADLLQEAVPAFGLAESVSFSGQGNCNSSLKQKMDEIERMIPAARKFFSRSPRGMSVRATGPNLIM